MTPVEKAARAFWDAQIEHLVRAHDAPRRGLVSWDEADATQKALATAGVRAVIKSLMEPSEAMLKAGSAADALTVHYGPDDYTKEATKVWQAMLRAAIEEKAP